MVLQHLPAFLVLVGTTLASVSTVLEDINTLDQDVRQLTTSVSDFEGGLLKQAPLLGQLTQVHLATRQGYHAAAALPSTILSIPDAESIIDLVNNTLSVDNPKAIAALRTKRTFFDATLTTGVVKAGLQVLLNDHLDFSNEILERTPATLITEANEVVDIITNALQRGIETYS